MQFDRTQEQKSEMYVQKIQLYCVNIQSNIYIILYTLSFLTLDVLSPLIEIPQLLMRVTHTHTPIVDTDTHASALLSFITKVSQHIGF